NKRSVIVSTHFAFGQPGAPGIGVWGGSVVTSKVTFPFLISDAGIDCEPETVTGAGFCPGGRCSPVPGLVQVAVAFADAESKMTTSSLPRPTSAPTAFSVNP